MDIRIVVGLDAWVWVGCWARSRHNPDVIVLKHSRCVEKLGTEGDLLEPLCAGPQKDTRVAKSGVTRHLHRLTVVDSLSVRDPLAVAAWRKALEIP